MHKSQVFLYLLSAFLWGTFSASILVMSSLAVNILIVIGAMVLAVSAYHKTFTSDEAGIYKRKLGFLAGVILIVFAAAVYRFNIYNSSHSALLEFSDREVKQEIIDIKLVGYVDGAFDINGNRGSFPMAVKYVVLPGRTWAVDERTLVQTAVFPKYEYGAPVLVTGQLMVPKNFSDFDYVTYLKKESIRTLMSAKDITLFDKDMGLGFSERAQITVYKKLFKIKNTFENKINGLMSEPYASYINGILLGTRQNIPADVMNDFKRTGTTHVLAISGYNIMIIAAALLYLLTFAMRRRKAFWLSVGIIAAFTLITGASASVVRAMIMGLLYLFATGYGRQYDARNSILLAGVVMVFINPLLLIFDVGFQLSFAAVLGLLYLYPLLKNLFRRVPAIYGIKDVLLMTLAAQIAVSPLLIYYFKQLSVVSLPANLIILPLMPVVMLFGFLAGLGGLLFFSLGQIFGAVATGLSAFQLWAVDVLADLPGAAVEIRINLPVLIILYALIIGSALWYARKTHGQTHQ